MGIVLKYSNKIVYKDGNDRELTLLFHVCVRSETIDCVFVQNPGLLLLCSLLSCRGLRLA